MEHKCLAYDHKLASLDIEDIFFDLDPNNLAINIVHIRLLYQKVAWQGKYIFFSPYRKHMMQGKINIYVYHNPKSLDSHMIHIFYLIQKESPKDKHKPIFLY